MGVGGVMRPRQICGRGRRRLHCGGCRSAGRRWAGGGWQRVFQGGGFAVLTEPIRDARSVRHYRGGWGRAALGFGWPGRQPAPCRGGGGVWAEGPDSDGAGRAKGGAAPRQPRWQRGGRGRRICRAGGGGILHWTLLLIRGDAVDWGCQVSVVSGLVVSGEVKWLIDFPVPPEF